MTTSTLVLWGAASLLTLPAAAAPAPQPSEGRTTRDAPSAQTAAEPPGRPAVPVVERSTAVRALAQLRRTMQSPPGGDEAGARARPVCHTPVLVPDDDVDYAMRIVTPDPDRRFTIARVPPKACAP